MDSTFAIYAPLSSENKGYIQFTGCYSIKQLTKKIYYLSQYQGIL